MSYSAVAIPILPSRNLDETEKFYVELGFSTYRRYAAERYLIMTRSTLELHFFENPELDPATNDGGCYLRVGDVDGFHKAFAHLKLPAAGIPRLSPVRDEAWGMREFHLVDPSGTLVRVGMAIT